MMWEGEATEKKYLPGLLETVYVKLTAVKKYAEESSTEVWYMIFMLIVHLNSLLQGSCIFLKKLKHSSPQIAKIFTLKLLLFFFYNLIAWLKILHFKTNTLLFLLN